MHKRIRIASYLGVVAMVTLGCAFDGNAPGAPASENLPASGSTTSGPPLDPAPVTTGDSAPDASDPGSTAATHAPATSTGGESTGPIEEETSESSGDAPRPRTEACPEDRSLVACWDFDFDGIDDSGLLVDGTSNALDATVSGVAWAEGPFGGATRFDQESRVYLGGGAPLDLEEAVTLDAWIYIDAAAAEGDLRRGIFDHQGQYAMFYYPGQGIRCSGLNEVFGQIREPAAERWMHVACTFGDGQLRVFVDGVVAAQTRFEGPLPTGGSELVALGNNTPRFDAPFLGAMALVRVWARALTPADIAALATPSRLAHPQSGSVPSVGQQ